VLSRFKDRSSDGGAPMSFMDHLLELRRRLWICALAVCICVTLSLAFYSELFAFLRVPLDNVNKYYGASPEFQSLLKERSLPPTTNVVDLQTTQPLSLLMVVMWLGMGAGLILGSPVLLYELWAFVAPGLKPRERRAIRPVLFGGIIFFLAGCVLTYYVLFPVTLDFMVWLAVQLHVRPIYTVDDYMSLLLTMMGITGLCCETPLVVGVLSKLGVIAPHHLTRYWRPCVLAAFILGAVFSPGTDLLSMLVFSALLLSLYILSIIMAWLFRAKPVS
jgi:sec-independent protein translocase protein TatC